MSGKVHITPGGFEVLTWDGDAGQWVERPYESVLEILRCRCHIDSGVTLLDIFRAVDRDPELVHFLERWSWCNVRAFHREALRPATGECEITSLEISRDLQWDEFGAHGDTHFGGLAEAPPDPPVRYGIELTPVHQIAHLPIRLRPFAEIFHDGVKLGEAPASFHLLDVLGEIYWEISFFGSPESRDAKLEDLQTAAREVEEDRAGLTPIRIPGKLVQ